MRLRDSLDRSVWRAAPEEKRAAIEAEIRQAVDAALLEVHDYPSLYRAASSIGDELKRRGFELQLFDEDGESLVTLTELRDDRTGMVIELAWDDDEGANALVQFGSVANVVP